MEEVKKAKKLSKRIIALIVAGVILATVLLTALGLAIAFWVADGIQVWSPDYDKTDLAQILEKSELTDGDYKILYEQTGLTKIGIDRALRRGETGKKKIKDIQEDYFKKYEVKNDKFAPYVCTDRLADGKSMINIYLEKGDIVVTSSTHISGVRIGHSGLVTNASQSKVLQAMAYGTPTFEGRIGDFTSRVNFMIFSVKCEDSVKSDAADYALKSYKGVPYSGFIGVFSPKDTAEKTQCAHMIWQAYRQYGIDLDANGGLLITPQDLANSPNVELVQVFGFDPQTLWKY